MTSTSIEKKYDIINHYFQKNNLHNKKLIIIKRQINTL